MNTTQSDLSLTLTIRQCLASALSMALTDPLDLQNLPDTRDGDRTPLHEAWAGIQHLYADVKQKELGLGELPPGRVRIEPLLAWLSLDLRQRNDVWQNVFGLVVSDLCPPYETQYCHWKDPTYRAHQLADVAGFYDAFKFDPRARFAERQDHAALELQFLSLLLDRWRFALDNDLDNKLDHDARDVCAHAAGAFLNDHMIWWMPTFARCLERRIEQLALAESAKSCGDTFTGSEALAALSGVALVLRAFITTQRLAHGLTPNREIISPQVSVFPEEEGCHDSTCEGCS